MFEWDENKSKDCLKKRGFGFEIVRDFDFETALTVPDLRNEYGEVRYRSFNRIDGLGFSVTWTVRSSNVRIISVRRAHEKEMKRYGL